MAISPVHWKLGRWQWSKNLKTLTGLGLTFDVFLPSLLQNLCCINEHSILVSSFLMAIEHKVWSMVGKEPYYYTLSLPCILVFKVFATKTSHILSLLRFVSFTTALDANIWHRCIQFGWILVTLRERETVLKLPLLPFPSLLSFLHFVMKKTRCVNTLKCSHQKWGWWLLCATLGLQGGTKYRSWVCAGLLAARGVSKAVCSESSFIAPRPELITHMLCVPSRHS